MASVRDILAVKGSNVVQITPEATVFEAARRMTENRIGGLLVTEGNKICGVVTERDILRRVVAAGRDPGTSLVREIMTADVFCCHPHTSVEEARVAMKERRIRHIPVLDNGQLCGLVSIGDLNAHEAQSKEMTIHLLNQYIHGFASVPEPGQA
jgi:CBS domain-containing protein